MLLLFKDVTNFRCGVIKTTKERIICTNKISYRRQFDSAQIIYFNQVSKYIELMHASFQTMCCLLTMTTPASTKLMIYFGFNYK